MSSSAAKTHEQLTVNELSRVHEELISIASKWKLFGGKIGVLPAELSNIEKSNTDFDDKLYKVLEYRLKQLPPLTWPDIVRALRSPAVHEHALASHIGSKYSQLHTPLSGTMLAAPRSIPQYSLQLPPSSVQPMLQPLSVPQYSVSTQLTQRSQPVDSPLQPMLQPPNVEQYSVSTQSTQLSQPVDSPLQPMLQPQNVEQYSVSTQSTQLSHPLDSYSMRWSQALPSQKIPLQPSAALVGQSSQPPYPQNVYQQPLLYYSALQHAPQMHYSALQHAPQMQHYTECYQRPWIPLNPTILPTIPPNPWIHNQTFTAQPRIRARSQLRGFQPQYQPPFPQNQYQIFSSSSQYTQHPSLSRYDEVSFFDQTLLPNIPRAQCSYTQSMPPCVTTLSSGDYITPSNYSLGQHPVSSASAASHLISTQNVPSPSNLRPATETISAQSPTHSLQSYSPGQQLLSFSTPSRSIPPVRTSSASATEGPPATKRLRQGSFESLGTQPQSQSTCTADIHHHQHLPTAVDTTSADPSKVNTFIKYGVGPPEVQSDQGTRELEKYDLKVVFGALLPVAGKYVFFGIQIGVDMNEIDEIRKQFMNDTRECLLRVLRIRLGRTPALTWKDIDTALRSKAVDESRLANTLMQEYGHLFSHKQTFESQDDGRKGSEKKHKSTKKGKYVGEDRSQQVGKEREKVNTFINYLKQKYSVKVVENDKKWSLSPTVEYINLACIDRKCVKNKDYEDLTKDMVKDGNVDAIQEKKGPIKFSEIAEGISLPSDPSVPESDSKRVVNDRRLILVEGALGVGKSTFAWEFCRKWWLKKNVAQQYDLVLLLRLRDKGTRNARDLQQLISHPLPGVSEAVCHELVMPHNFHALIILEGYDELPESQRNDSCSIFNQLISGELLPLATVLVTSRPWATKGIRKYHERHLYQHIEVLGFTKRQITEYIKKTVPKDQVKDLNSYLERHPQIKSGMYIPLNSAIVVAVYIASKADQQPMPNTITELYTCVVHISVRRHLEGQLELHGGSVKSLPAMKYVTVPCEVHRNFLSLCKLAYDGLVSEKDEVRLIFSESELPPNFDNLGFMDSVTKLYVTGESSSSHNFLHLTFQEFFAAVHISTLPPEEQLKYFTKDSGKNEGRLKVTLKFLAGLKKLDCITKETVGSIFKPIVPSEGSSKYQIHPDIEIDIDIVNWMFESQSEDIMCLMLSENKVRFEADKDEMLPMDYYSLGYCISHSKCQWLLSLTGKRGLSNEKIQMLAKGTTGSVNGGRV